MAELKFEEALKKLESIVEGLEQGKISLEDSLKKYEEGIKLAKFCSEKLDEAEKKIEILSRDSSGKVKKQPFAPKEEEDKKETTKTPKQKKQSDQEGFLF